jgi:hypothetical protein
VGAEPLDGLVEGRPDQPVVDRVDVSGESSPLAKDESPQLRVGVDTVKRRDGERVHR